MGCQKYLTSCLGQPNFGKNGQKISENILEYYRKSEIVFICIFVIKNDLNMIKITGGLSTMFAQLSGTTKFWKKWPKDR